jgi:hypothetical protein
LAAKDKERYEKEKKEWLMVNAGIEKLLGKFSY